MSAPLHERTAHEIRRAIREKEGTVRQFARILGKLNRGEFVLGSTTENSGRFTTKNPWDLERAQPAIP